VPTLRPTEIEDLDQVVAIESSADTVEWLGAIGHEWHRRAIADPDQEHLVAKSDGIVMGFGVVAGLCNVDGTIELRRMVVHPDFRGRGRGRWLLVSLTRRAYERHGGRHVWLDVKSDNRRARALYGSEGFVPAETATARDGPPNGLIVMVHTGDK
jgi:diamine N-acetyltransferase